MEFEGEFLFNKKWKGKGYDKNYDIFYELNNDKKEVKAHLNDGRLCFELQYLNDELIKKIKAYDSDGTLYLEGEYINVILFGDINTIYNDCYNFFPEEDNINEDIIGKIRIYDKNNILKL